MKSKFIQQQILTSIGILGLLSAIAFSIVTGEYLILIWSFFYSQVIVCLLGEQIILHRYFSHRSFKVNKAIHYILSLISFLPGQGSPIAWAAAHRHHHKHSDRELDNHSPRESYMLAAGGWLLKGYEWVINVKKLRTIPTDLLRDKWLVKIDKFYYIVWWLLIALGLLVSYKFTLFFLIAPVGWTLFISAMVTLGCHIRAPGGYRSHQTPDDSQNNLIIQLVVLGDALHNNHHQYPSNWKNSNKWYEFDTASTIIRLIKLKEKI